MFGLLPEWPQQLHLPQVLALPPLELLLVPVGLQILLASSGASAKDVLCNAAE